MTTSSRRRTVAVDTPVSSETRATIACVMLAISAAIVLMWPRYAEFGPVTLGEFDRDIPEKAVDNWHRTIWGNAREVHYSTGSTCTDIDSLLPVVLCR